jgi:hypothetical protein
MFILQACSTATWYQANVASLSFCIVCIWAWPKRWAGAEPANVRVLGVLMSAIGPKLATADEVIE